MAHSISGIIQFSILLLVNYFKSSVSQKPFLHLKYFQRKTIRTRMLNF